MEKGETVSLALLKANETHMNTNTSRVSKCSLSEADKHLGSKTDDLRCFTEPDQLPAPSPISTLSWATGASIKITVHKWMVQFSRLFSQNVQIFLQGSNKANHVGGGHREPTTPTRLKYLSSCANALWGGRSLLQVFKSPVETKQTKKKCFCEGTACWQS